MEGRENKGKETHCAEAFYTGSHQRKYPKKGGWQSFEKYQGQFFFCGTLSKTREGWQSIEGGEEPKEVGLGIPL